MIILIETLILLILFTIMVFLIAKDPIKTLYNYPPEVQAKVKTLKRYQDKIPTTKNMLITKLVAAVGIVVLVSLLFRYVNSS